jgi:hypothetical protein
VTAPAVARWLDANKGSLTAPLFFLSLVLAGLGSRYGVTALWAGAALAMAGAGVAGAVEKAGWTWLAVCMTAYAALAVSSTLLLSPAYSPAGLYHPLLLASGFLVARRFDERALRAAVKGMLLFALILALWGAAEIGSGAAGRAHALFETPATYAAVLNLCLLPVLATILVTGCRTPLAIVGVVLAIGVLAADSRGGMLALAAGTAVAIVLSMRVRMLRPRALAIVLTLVAAGWIAALALRSLPSTPAANVPGTEARAESSLARMELYALSLKAWRKQPVAGTGYLTFRYTLEQGRAEVPSYGVASETWFVHNDYLQTLQELGFAGLLAVVGLAALPPLLAYRRIPAVPAPQRPVAIGCASALAAMAVHALVDFPFYVPVCLLLYGALLGALDRQLIVTPRALQPARRSPLGPRALRTGALAIAALILLRPVAAEAAAEWGLRKFSDGDGQRAAFWLGAAQRIDPRDWRYHWYAGQFWDAQTAQSGKRAAAQLAANAYAAGFEANPLEINNLLGMISVHKRYRDLLQAPADSATLKKWSARAAVLAPLHPQVARLLSK